MTTLQNVALQEVVNCHCRDRRKGCNRQAHQGILPLGDCKGRNDTGTKGGDRNGVNPIFLEIMHGR
jgi:hypothetical protein